MAKLDIDLLTYIFLTLLHCITNITGESVSVCFSVHQQSLPINCGSGYMVRITNTFYGYSNTNKCSFQPGDCIQAEHEAYPCTGRDMCSINLPSGSVGKRLTNCDRDSTYFQVEYSCEPVIQTKDICRSSLLTAQRGFVSTPRYPNNYHENLDCLTQIRVHPSQSINLTIIDMDLDRNGSYGCNDYMDAFNDYRSVTLCGRRTNEKVTTLPTNEISVLFKSDRQTNKKGFWIYYEAYPPLPPTRAPTMTRGTDPPPPTTQRSADKHHPNNTPNSAEKSASSTTESKEKLPFVAIVSGVIGTLTFILIVLLILLVYRWWHDKQNSSYKRKSQDVEYLDTRNPAFRSSTGTEFGGIEIYYNC